MYSLESFLKSKRGVHTNLTMMSIIAETPVSMTMPLKERHYKYSQFPPFFDGLLPEGIQLEALLKIGKIDSDDYLEQLIRVGHDLVGNVTVEEMK